jgi:predicted acetyltransferase
VDKMEIKIIQVSREQKEILRNLMEKYDYEFSQYENMDVNDIGLYGYNYIDHYWTEENRYAFFIKINGKLAGFIMVNNIDETEMKTNFSMAEFFIMYKYKRLGIGAYAVKNIFEKFKGKWEITYAQNNIPANKFWNKIVYEYTNGKYKKIADYKNFDDGLKRDALVFCT